MAVNTGFYSMMKAVDLPDMNELKQKQMTLSQLGMQNEALQRQAAAAPAEQAYLEQTRKNALANSELESNSKSLELNQKRQAILGSALGSLEKMAPEQRQALYPSVRSQLIKSQAISEQDAPEQYDDNFFNQALSTYKGSDKYLNRTKTEAEINKLNMEAKKAGKPQMDPMQFFVAKEVYKDREDKRKQIEERTTDYGVARTADDAKKIKDAAVIKDSFDRKLGELIKLREEKGGELLDRVSVARAQQLSKELLLDYKNIASLGVLSQSDENILNAIIPSDPLEFNLSSVGFKDPVMNKLKKFQSDTNADFTSRVKNRVVPSDSIQMKQAGSKEPNKNTFNMTTEELLKELEQ